MSALGTARRTDIMSEELNRGRAAAMHARPSLFNAGFNRAAEASSRTPNGFRTSFAETGRAVEAYEAMRRLLPRTVPGQPHRSGLVRCPAFEDLLEAAVEAECLAAGILRGTAGRGRGQIALAQRQSAAADLNMLD